MEPVDSIRSMILDYCANQEWDWKGHIEGVVKYSKILAKQLDADEEVCEISAWLHDIIKVRDGKRELHNVYGAKEARKILKPLKYPNKKIKQVEHCIISHSTDGVHAPKSLEAKILRSADALSHFDNFSALSYYVYNMKEYNLEKGRTWLLKKYEKSWNKLILPEAKQIAKPKYDAIMLLLRK